MRTIEAQLHDLLLDIAPESYDEVEQAKIIAEAAESYEKLASSGKSKKRFASTDEEDDSDPRLAAALLSAMEAITVVASVDEDDTDGSVLDGRGLDPDQIVRSAATKPLRRYSGKSSFPHMNVLEDDDLDAILNGSIEGKGAEDYRIDDGEDEHIADLYTSLNLPCHRSDALAH